MDGDEIQGEVEKVEVEPAPTPIIGKKERKPLSEDSLARLAVARGKAVQRRKELAAERKIPSSEIIFTFGP